MKNRLPLAQPLVPLSLVVNTASAQFTYEQDFSSPTLEPAPYTASVAGVSPDDGAFIIGGSDQFSVFVVDQVPDDAPFSTGNELRNGYKFDGTAITTFTLPKSVGVWDSSLDYTFSINVRSFDTADSDGSVNGNFNRLPE